MIGSFLKHVKDNTNPEIYGSGEQARDFCYIDNVIQAQLSAMLVERKLDGQVFNIGTGQPTTINRLASLMKTLEPNYMPERVGDIFKSTASLMYAQRALEYSPDKNLSKQLEKTIEWYMEKK